MSNDPLKPAPTKDGSDKSMLPKDLAEPKPSAEADGQTVKPEPGAGPPHQEFGGERS